MGTITSIALSMGLLPFAASLLFVGLDLRESLVFAIVIVVANVPEGLLPTVTLALALSVQRMARQNVLVRRLSAVETLGSVAVICTDKTGTLTCNRMVVESLLLLGDPTETALLLAAAAALGDPVRFKAAADDRPARLERGRGLAGGGGADGHHQGRSSRTAAPVQP